jgi:hypothetical protein
MKPPENLQQENVFFVFFRVYFVAKMLKMAIGFSDSCRLWPVAVNNINNLQG